MFLFYSGAYYYGHVMLLSGTLLAVVLPDVNKYKEKCNGHLNGGVHME